MVENICVPKPSESNEEVQAGYFYPVPGIEDAQVFGQLLPPAVVTVPLPQSEEDQMLTGNFAWGVIDLGNEDFTELDPAVGTFMAISR